MTRRALAWAVILVGAPVLLYGPQATRADIMGFNSLTGWQYNQADNLPPASFDPPPDRLHILSTYATPVALASRNIFYTVRQPIVRFNASITLEAMGLTTNFGCGSALVLQTNSPTVFGGGDYGYLGIPHSIALGFDHRWSGSGSPGTGWLTLYKNGSKLGSSGVGFSYFELISGHPTEIAISYDGEWIREQVTDTITHYGGFAGAWLPNLANFIGSQEAFVGFTAGSYGCAPYPASDYLSRFQFHGQLPEPATLGLMAASGLAIARQKRRRTDPRK
ncbi:MAG: PEP-CTERM sorting domain-containing protein [Phycisphaerae bacterium]